MKVDREFEKLLISDFEVFRKKRTPDGAGGFETELESKGVIKGRLSIRSTTISRDYTRAMQDIAAYTYILFTLTGEDIEKDDIIVGEGKELRVIIVKEPSHMGHHWEIEVEDIVPSGGF